MGTLRSATDHSGNEFKGVTLGIPVRLLNGEPCPIGETPDEYQWEHSRLPSGQIDAAGAITPDTSPLGVAAPKGTKAALKWSSLEAASRAASFGIAVESSPPALDTA